MRIGTSQGCACARGSAPLPLRVILKFFGDRIPARLTAHIISTYSARHRLLECLDCQPAFVRLLANPRSRFVVFEGRGEQREERSRPQRHLPRRREYAWERTPRK